MRVMDLIFIFTVLVAVCIGGIVIIASGNNPVGYTDTFGNAPSDQTNRSAELVGAVTTAEASYSGWFLLFAVVAVIIVIMLGFFYSLRKGGIGRGKYRSG